MKQLLFAVPNGGNRNKITAAIMKSEGVRAGISDLILLKPSNIFHALCIELKAPKGKQTESQKQFEQSVLKLGYLYVVVNSFDNFKQVIEDYFNGTISN